MISFTLITSTPVVARTQLVNRGIITLQTVNGVPNTSVPVLEGLEWLEVPNPIVTTKAVGVPSDVGYVPAVMDTRHCFLVKMVRDAEADQIAGITQLDGQGNLLPLAQRTKWGQWVIANSTADTLVSDDGRSWPARKVGTNTWLTASDDFGVWQ